MTSNQFKQALLRDPLRPKVVRTNDGRSFLIRGVECWALANGTLTVALPGDDWFQYIAVHNIASIGPARRRRKSR